MTAGFPAPSHEAEVPVAKAAPPAAALSTQADAANQQSVSVAHSEAPSRDTAGAPGGSDPAPDEKPANAQEASQPMGTISASASENAAPGEANADLDASAVEPAADTASLHPASESETAAPSAPATPKTPAQSHSESARSHQEFPPPTPPASQPSPKLPPLHSRQQQVKGGLPAEGAQSEIPAHRQPD